MDTKKINVAASKKLGAAIEHRFGKKPITYAQYSAAVQTKWLTEREMKKLTDAWGVMAESMDEYDKLKDAHGIAQSRIRSYNKQKAKRK